MGAIPHFWLVHPTALFSRKVPSLQQVYPPPPGLGLQKALSSLMGAIHTPELTWDRAETSPQLRPLSCLTTHWGGGAGCRQDSWEGQAAFWTLSLFFILDSHHPRPSVCGVNDLGYVKPGHAVGLPFRFRCPSRGPVSSAVVQGSLKQHPVPL